VRSTAYNNAVRASARLRRAPGYTAPYAVRAHERLGRGRAVHGRERFVPGAASRTSERYLTPHGSRMAGAPGLGVG
jgi:hypothetical protein